MTRTPTRALATWRYGVMQELLILFSYRLNLDVVFSLADLDFFSRGSGRKVCSRVWHF